MTMATRLPPLQYHVTLPRAPGPNCRLVTVGGGGGGGQQWGLHFGSKNTGKISVVFYREIQSLNRSEALHIVITTTSITPHRQHFLFHTFLSFSALYSNILRRIFLRFTPQRTPVTRPPSPPSRMEYSPAASTLSIPSEPLMNVTPLVILATCLQVGGSYPFSTILHLIFFVLCCFR